MKTEWKVKGQGEPVIKVLESFNGDLYFITEIDEESQDIFCYARLYSMPQFAEWGYNNLDYLYSQYGKNKLWEVRERNWPNLDTYEEGILIKSK